MWATPTRLSGTRAAAAALFAASCLIAGCAGWDSVPKPRDVLIITIDTARADRFSYAGATSPGTPRVDALASEGAGFVDAISPVPLTLPAHASLMTGRLPPTHTVRDNGAYRLPDSETTLAEILEAGGFTTGAFVGAQVLDKRYGLDQGFATYDDRIPDPGTSPLRYYAERKGEEVVASAGRWLDAQGDRPVFVWVHLFDPHTPYRPPEPERSRFASGYDGEIAYTDRVIGRLLDHWATRRGLERTLVVVTSDHGEGLGEHGEPTHGVLVHEATLRVPLVIKSPGLRARGPIAAPVSLIDVMPTVLALLGVPTPPGIQGRNLVPLLRGETLPWSRAAGYAESLYAERHHGCTPLVALRESGWKLVRGRVDELYDLNADPAESNDLVRDEPVRAADLGTALAALSAEIAGGEAETVPLDDESRRALQALGYVWATPPAAPGGGRDPREALASLRRMADADRSLLRGDAEAAIVAYRAVLEVEPASVDARFRLAQIFITLGRLEEAIGLLAEAVALDPDEPFLYQSLGNTLERSERFADALATYDAGLSRHPGIRGLRDGRWRCLDRLGRYEILLKEAEHAIAEDPSDGMARYARVIACCGRDSDEDYIAALARELAALPENPILEGELARAREEARQRVRR